MALDKVSMFMKPFLPQLQRTFVKALIDSSSQVRKRACQAVGKLVTLQPRIEPLLTELQGHIKSATPDTKESLLTALYTILAHTKATIPESFMKTVVPLLHACSDDNGIVSFSSQVTFFLILTACFIESIQAIAAKCIQKLDG
jgi:vesicle coat complex subunit